MKTREKVLRRLEYLERNHVHWTIKSVAEDLGLSVPAVHGHLERMARDGLIKRGERLAKLKDVWVTSGVSA